MAGERHPTFPLSRQAGPRAAFARGPRSGAEPTGDSPAPSGFGPRTQARLRRCPDRRSAPASFEPDFQRRAARAGREHAIIAECRGPTGFFEDAKKKKERAKSLARYGIFWKPSSIDDARSRRAFARTRIAVPPRRARAQRPWSRNPRPSAASLLPTSPVARSPPGLDAEGEPRACPA